MKRLVAAVSMLAVLTACETDDDTDAEGPPESESGGPLDESAEMAPDRMDVSPTTLTPGSTAGVTFTEQTERGRVYALERRQEDDWQWHFTVTSDAHS